MGLSFILEKQLSTNPPLFFWQFLNNDHGVCVQILTQSLFNIKCLSSIYYKIYKESAKNNPSCANFQLCNVHTPILCHLPTLPIFLLMQLPSPIMIKIHLQLPPSIFLICELDSPQNHQTKFYTPTSWLLIVVIMSQFWYYILS